MGCSLRLILLRSTKQERSDRTRQSAKFRQRRGGRPVPTGGTGVAFVAFLPARRAERTLSGLAADETSNLPFAWRVFTIAAHPSATVSQPFRRALSAVTCPRILAGTVTLGQPWDNWAGGRDRPGRKSQKRSRRVPRREGRRGLHDRDPHRDARDHRPPAERRQTLHERRRPWTLRGRGRRRWNRQDAAGRAATYVKRSGAAGV